MGGVEFNAATDRIAEEFKRIGANAAAARNADGGGSFGSVLSGLLEDANELQVNADVEARKLMTGESSDVHQVMLSMAKADVSFRMMLEVRNKLLDAYQEVMRMQV